MRQFAALLGVIIVCCLAGGATVARAAGANPQSAAFSVSPNPTIGAPVTFDGSASTCDLAPCTYTWDDDGGEPPVGYWPLGSGKVINFTFTGSAFTAYVRLTVTDALGETATVEHNVYVATPQTPTNTAPPMISGNAQQGSTLSTSTGAWSGSPTSYAYQWQDCDSASNNCTNINGAKNATYTVQASDVGHTLVAVVSAENTYGSTSQASDPTSVVVASGSSAPSNGSPPANSAAPQLSGSARVGQALSASSGAWSNGPTGYSYQWYDCDAVGNNCSAVSGATGSSYTPGWSDVGDTEYVAVTGSNGAGSATVKSAMTPAVEVPAWSPAATANLWVSTTAGSCARNATGAAYSASTACGSLQAAYSIARCGDTIEIEPGSYDSQDLDDVSSLDACASPVIMEGASTSTPPVIANVTAQYVGAGASNFVLEGIKQTATSCTSDQGGGCDDIFLAGGKNVYLNQISGGSVGIFGDKHVLVQNSSFGPCYTGTTATGDCTNNIKIDTNWVNCSTSCPTSDVTFIGNSFNQFLDNGDSHFECMFLRGGNEIMIDSNHFHTCQLQGIMIQPTDESMNETVIQNNWLDEIENSVNSAPYYDTGYVAADTRTNAIDFAGNTSTEGANETGVIIRYNSLDPYSAIMFDGAATPAGPNTIYGNIAGVNTACLPNTTYGYNMFLSGQQTCASTDTTVSNLPFINTGYGNEDFHLTCNSPADGYVTATSTPSLLSYDKTLSWRTTANPPDAGSQSESSCGT